MPKTFKCNHKTFTSCCWGEKGRINSYSPEKGKLKLAKKLARQSTNWVVRKKCGFYIQNKLLQ